MVSEYRTIRTMRAVILLQCRVVLCVLLLLVSSLVLKVVHHRHPASTGPAIDAAVLPLLVALIKHPVQTMCSGLGVWRSRRRRYVGREGGSSVTGRRAATEDLLSGLRREEVVPSGLLRKSVTIGHLIQSTSGRTEALARCDERKPWGSRRSFRVDRPVAWRAGLGSCFVGT